MTPRDRTALRQWELRFGPNMTPMVDIVMVILIFFMAASALLGPEWFLRTALPGTGAAAAPQDPFQLPPARFELHMVRDNAGQTVVTGWGAPATLEETESRLLDLGKDAASPGGGGTDVIVLIDPDAAVPYKDVVRLHDACLRAGINQVGLTARKP